MEQEQWTGSAPELAQHIKEYTDGQAIRAWEYMGAHTAEREGQTGHVFRVWAPHAAAVSVVGDFNQWVPGCHPLE